MLEKDRINAMFFLYSYGYTFDARLHVTEKFLQNIQDPELDLIFENAIKRGVLGCVREDFFVCQGNRLDIYIDRNDLCGLGVPEFLP